MKATCRGKRCRLIPVHLCSQLDGEQRNLALTKVPYDDVEKAIAIFFYARSPFDLFLVIVMKIRQKAPPSVPNDAEKTRGPRSLQTIWCQTVQRVQPSTQLVSTANVAVFPLSGIDIALSSQGGSGLSLTAQSLGEELAQTVAVERKRRLAARRRRHCKLSSWLYRTSRNTKRSEGSR
jgi:hypothetical protein